VSWQVTGVRHDPYAEAHRSPVEVQKPVAERGYYLHPELYPK
jgi:trimeric autotransporter adhesin